MSVQLGSCACSLSYIHLSAAEVIPCGNNGGNKPTARSTGAYLTLRKLKSSVPVSLNITLALNAPWGFLMLIQIIM
jgi:hypothetical protein